MYPSHILAASILLAACSSGSGSIGGDDTGAVDSSGDGGSEDGGDVIDDDGGAGDGGEDGGGDGGDTEPVPDYSTWDGAVVVSLDAYGESWDCYDDTISLSGVALAEGDDAYDAVMAECWDCDQVYEITPSATEACPDMSWPGPIDLPATFYRGVKMGDGVATVYSFDVEDGDVSMETLSNAADFDGWAISYEYDVDYYAGSVITVIESSTFGEAR